MTISTADTRSAVPDNISRSRFTANTWARAPALPARSASWTRRSDSMPIARISGSVRPGAKPLRPDEVENYYEAGGELSDLPDPTPPQDRLAPQHERLDRRPSRPQLPRLPETNCTLHQRPLEPRAPRGRWGRRPRKAMWGSVAASTAGRACAIAATSVWRRHERQRWTWCSSSPVKACWSERIFPLGAAMSRRASRPEAGVSL